MKERLLLVAVVLSLADLTAAQQIIPVSGHEDLRLQNRSPFDPAMVTLQFEADDQAAVTGLPMRLEPGEELIVNDVIRAHFGLAQDTTGQLVILGPEIVVAQWSSASTGARLWKPAIALAGSSATITASATGTRRRAAGRSSQPPEIPTLVRVGDITAFAGSYGVSGTATLVAKNIIRLSEFRHNGTAPGIDLRLGLSTTPRRNFAILRVTARQPFNGTTLDLTLPDSIDLNSFDTFTVWCYEFNVIIAEGRFKRP